MTDNWLTPPDVDARPIPMPEGFQPNAHHRALAIQFGVDLEEAFATFVDHHASKGNKFKSWDRALNTWLRRERQFARQRPTDRQFVFQAPQLQPCPVGFCDGIASVGGVAHRAQWHSRHKPTRAQRSNALQATMRIRKCRRRTAVFCWKETVWQDGDISVGVSHCAANSGYSVGVMT